MAYCFSSVFSDPNIQGGYQLLSQGTGDILASLCSDVWDGRDIVPLSDRERELILGFHNRHLSSAYCIGFAYSPLVDKIEESYRLLLGNLPSSSDIFMLRLPGVRFSISNSYFHDCFLNDTELIKHDYISLLYNSLPYLCKFIHIYRRHIHFTSSNMINIFLSITIQVCFIKPLTPISG